jgi:hypothetical protein
MKQIILILILALSANQFLSAQITDTLHKSSATNQHQEYLEKSSHQKSAAITLLVIGGTTMIVGAIGTAANALDAQGNTYATVFLVGTAVSLCSIPLFIAAHRNKNKAALALKLESTPLANILPSRSGAIGLGIIFKF